MNTIRRFREFLRKRRLEMECYRELKRIEDLCYSEAIPALWKCKYEPVICHFLNGTYSHWAHDVLAGRYVDISDEKKGMLVDLMIRYYKSGKSYQPDHIYAVLDKLRFNSFAIEYIYNYTVRNKSSDSADNVFLEVLRTLSANTEVFSVDSISRNMYIACRLAIYIKNRETLKSIVDSSSSSATLRTFALCALERFDEVAVFFLEKCEYKDINYLAIALNSVKNKDILERVALNHENSFLRSIAAENLQNLKVNT